MDVVNRVYACELPNGTCTITQTTLTLDGYASRFEITMGATADGRTWRHGPAQVSCRDSEYLGGFRWGDCRLAVDDLP